jgi:hypothetical protein
VHRVAERGDPGAATQLCEARAAHKAIEPLLLEIGRIEELQRAIRAAALANQRAMPIPQLAPEHLKLQERLQEAEGRYAPIYKEAQIFLRQSFGDGRLQTFCLRFTDGELEPIPAPRWWTRAGDYAFSTELWNPGSRDKRAIGRVLVREADLETLLLPQGGGSPTPAECITPVPNDAPADASRLIMNGPPRKRRPLYSPGALSAWFVLRVQSWPADAPFPTEAEDLKAARIAFEGEIPRDQFREIRRNKTLARWRKPGPRRARQ